MLGGIASSYLGLVMTRGLRGLEIVLGIATMGLLIFTAAEITKSDMSTARAIALEIAVATLALIYRLFARARWHGLDWMVCRNPVTARGAG